MYNKKLISTILDVLGVLLIVKLVLTIAMYIWGFAGQPPLVLLDLRLYAEPWHTHLVIMTEMIAGLAVQYAVLAVLKAIINKKEVKPAVKIAPKLSIKAPKRKSSKR